MQKEKRNLIVLRTTGDRRYHKSADKINVKAGKLSFGQQQRVAFIRALCQPFDFLFLDEPISHLDDDNSRIMGELIIAEAKAQGAGVIATSIGKHIELPYNHTLQL